MGELHARNMAGQDAVAMQRAFGWPRRSRREDHQRRIIRTGFGDVEDRGMAIHQFGESSRIGTRPINADDMLQRRQASADLPDAFETEAIGDDGRGTCRLQPVFQRLDAEEQRQWQRDRAGLVDRHMCDHRFEGLWQ